MKGKASYFTAFISSFCLPYSTSSAQGPNNYVVGPDCIHVISGGQQKLSMVAEGHLSHHVFSQLERNMVIFLANSHHHHKAQIQLHQKLRRVIEAVSYFSKERKSRENYFIKITIGNFNNSSLETILLFGNSSKSYLVKS